MPDSLIFIIGVLVVFIGLLVLSNLRQAVVFEHERALLYRSGRFQRLLAPGSHWYVRAFHSVQKVDTRARFVSIVGQEVLSADNVSIRVSLAASYMVAEPFLAINASTNYQEALYLMLQLQLRDLVGSSPIDDLLAKRKEIGESLLENVKPKAAEIGLTLFSVGIKDIMFPGELKTTFAQVVSARKEGLAALERARGESASLRNLANTAKLLENNPALLQLRLLQIVSSRSGNTIVLKFPKESGTGLTATKQASSEENPDEMAG